MDSYLNSSLAMTGFIVDGGCLYAVLKGQDGETQLYGSTRIGMDHQRSAFTNYLPSFCCLCLIY